MKVANKLAGKSSIFSNALDLSKIKQIPTEYITTTSPTLDICMGGGFGKGKINVTYGPPKAGKSLLCTMAIGNYLKGKKDVFTLIIDTEGFYDNQDVAIGLENCGFDLSPSRTSVISSVEPESIQAAISELSDALDNETFSEAILFIDSLGGIQSEYASKQFDKGETNTNKMGGNAMWTGEISKLLIKMLTKHNLTVFITNHANVNMDNTYNDPTKQWIMAGGGKIKHLMRYLLKIETVERKDAGLLSSGDMMDKEQKNATVVKVGKTSRVTVEKTVGALDGKVAEIVMNTVAQKIVRNNETLFDFASKCFFEKEGTLKYMWPNKKEATTKATWISKMKDSPELVQELVKDITAHFKKSSIASEVDDE